MIAIVKDLNRGDFNSKAEYQGDYRIRFEFSDKTNQIIDFVFLNAENPFFLFYF